MMSYIQTPTPASTRMERKPRHFSMRWAGIQPSLDHRFLHPSSYQQLQPICNSLPRYLTQISSARHLRTQLQRDGRRSRTPLCCMWRSITQTNLDIQLAKLSADRRGWLLYITNLPKLGFVAETTHQAVVTIFKECILDVDRELLECEPDVDWQPLVCICPSVLEILLMKYLREDGINWDVVRGLEDAQKKKDDAVWEDAARSSPRLARLFDCVDGLEEEAISSRSD